MALSEEEKYKLEDFVERMKSYRARHTELITVYAPKGYDINLVTKQLESEKSTAANIKSTTTRKNVQDALESLIRVCKQMKRAPKNGVALFAGNVSQIEGQDNFITEVFEPPEELGMRLYRCDQTFVLDPLEEMLEVKDLYGLVVIERKEASIGLLVGKKIKLLRHIDSFVPGKIRAGGQCLSPDTIINVNGKNIKLRNVKVGDKISGFNFKTNKIEETICTNKWTVKKNIINLLSNNKKSITASKDHLFYVKLSNKIIEKAAEDLSIKDKLIDKNGKIIEITKIEFKNIRKRLIDIETKNHNFIANGLIVHNSAPRFARITEGLAKEFYRKIAEIVKKEFFNLKGLKGILVGGPGPTKEDFLKEGQLATALQDKVLAVKDIGYADEHGLDLLVESSQDVLAGQEIVKEQKILEKFFNMLGKEREKAAYGKKDVEKALEYGAVDILLLSKKLKKSEIQEFQKKAQETSVKVELISTETEEGIQFWNLSGIGAMLRFKIS